MHSDGLRLFQQFWWLIFPIFYMLWGMVETWLRHSRASRTIDILKSYADQGKDPPPELLAALRQPPSDPMNSLWGPGAKEESTRDSDFVPFFLFAGLAIAFVAVPVLERGWSPEHLAGPIFVAIIMGGLSIGMLVRALMRLGKDGDRRR